MNITKFNEEVKPYYVAYKAGILTQHEFIVAINFILNDNKIPYQTMIGDIVVLKNGKTEKQFFNKWILLPADDLIIDFCLRDVLNDQNLPFGVFTIKDLNDSYKNGTLQYRGTQAGNESSREMREYVDGLLTKAAAKIEKAQEISEEQG